MRLAEYYCGDPRLVLVPIEHLDPAGMSRAFAALVAERRGWSHARIELFDAGFALYWTRSAALAGRTRSWPAPRLRHVAVVVDPLSVRPYVQLLNTTAWMLYDADLDPENSHPELLAWLLALGDRMAITGEVTHAPAQAAAWWFERTPDERAAFAAAARRSPRPDAAGVRAVADALPWLAELRHESLRPPPAPAGHRPIPGTGLLVPPHLEDRPPALVEAWTTAARGALADHQRAWRGAPTAAAARLLDWLVSATPPVLVTGHGGRIVWDPTAPERLGAIRAELKQGEPVAIDGIRLDLEIAAARTAAVRAALATPEALPPPDPAAEQTGYTYMHRERGMIAYNLRERGMDRLHGPGLPFARAMLAARTAHEWAHRIVDAGWVPRTMPAADFDALRGALAARLDDVVAHAPAPVLNRTARDLATLGRDGSVGAALAGLFCARLSDYQSNLVTQLVLDEAERETYVRQNVRTLRGLYEPGDLWRMLVRYLYEYQYLGFSAVADPRTYLFRSTWFEDDFVATGVLDAVRFDELATAAAALCRAFAVDATRVRVSATG